MRPRSRILSSLMAASYLLATTVALRFHDHACREGSDCGAAYHSCEGANHSHSAGQDGAPGQDRPSPAAPDRHPTDSAKCVICHFLAQASTPVGSVVPLISAPLVQAVTVVTPSFSLTDVFSAWHSRGPPAVA
jgi:hypothetical protein